MDESLGPPPKACVRRNERRPVKLSGFIALPDGSTSEFDMIDMSYEGCRIATSAELSEGQPVQVAIVRLGSIAARVRWATGGEAGLLFDAAEVEKKREHVPRRSTRVPLGGEAMLRRPGKANYRARALDISPEGCRVEIIDRPEMDEQLWIKFDGLEALQARVCWIGGAHTGLEFVRPIHPAVFSMLMARIG